MLGRRRRRGNLIWLDFVDVHPPTLRSALLITGRLQDELKGELILGPPFLDGWAGVLAEPQRSAPPLVDPLGDDRASAAVMLNTRKNPLLP